MITPEERKIVNTIRSCISFEQLENAKHLANNYLNSICPNNTKHPDQGLEYIRITNIINWEIEEKNQVFLELAGSDEST